MANPFMRSIFILVCAFEFAITIIPFYIFLILMVLIGKVKPRKDDELGNMIGRLYGELIANMSLSIIKPLIILFDKSN